MLIETAEAELHDLADQAWAAIMMQNDPPQIFRRGSSLVYIGEGDRYRAALIPHNVNTLLDLMSRTAMWRKTDAKGNERVVFPPKQVAMIILDWDPQRWGDIPRIERVARSPFFAAPKGKSVWDVDDLDQPDHQVELITSPGYHRDAAIWYDPDPELEDLEVTGSPEDLRQAVRMVNAILRDFPFVGAGSRAHALSLLLLPFVRELIDGDTPLYLITAPTPGTGKGLLTDVLLSPAEREVPRSVAAQNEEEWRKRITSELLEAPSVILFDNVPPDPGLNSATMAAVLTAGGWWRDRILGHSRIATLPVRNVWVATGNNVAVSHENNRRVARIHLDRGVEDPAAVTGFAIKNLHSFIRKNRKEVVWAALTIIQNWLNGHTVEDDMYRPWLTQDGRLKQSYIEWSKVMGGIIKHVGVEGFLEQDDLTDNTERDELAYFLEAWERNAPNPISSDELAMLMSQYESEMNTAAPASLVGVHPSQLRSKVRYWLRSNTNCVAGGRQLQRVDGRPRKWVVRRVAG